MLDKEQDTDEVQSEPVLPKQLIGDRARELFTLYQEELSEIYRLTKGDVAVLITYCNLQEKQESLSEWLKSLPVTMQSGKAQAHQALRQLSDLNKQIAGLASTLGIGPANRAKLERLHRPAVAKAAGSKSKAATFGTLPFETRG